MLTNAQIEKINLLSYAKTKNMKVNAREVTDLYNEVMGKRVRMTTCQTCIKNRIGELEGRLAMFNEQQEKLKNAEQQTIQTEEQVDTVTNTVEESKTEEVEQPKEEQKQENKKKRKK